MPDNIFIWPLAGFVLMSTIGILLSRRIATGAFSLFAMLMGVAAIFASCDAHYAVVAQVVLYVGGVMVLIVFALFLYSDPPEVPKWNQFRENFGKAFLLILISAATMFYLPWKALSEFASDQQKLTPPVPKQNLAEVGRVMASQFAFEFELLGILLLACIIVAGWFIKQTEASKP